MSRVWLSGDADVRVGEIITGLSKSNVHESDLSDDFKIAVRGGSAEVRKSSGSEAACQSSEAAAASDDTRNIES